MRVAFYTLGCRMNQFDTDSLRSKFINSGYEPVDFDQEADVYVINTCTVTVGGDRASRKAIYKAKRKNPRAVVVATGCYAQVKPQELASMEEVDIVVGNTHREEVLKLLEEFFEDRKQRVAVGEMFRRRDVGNFDGVLYFEETRPFLKIQEGCNKFCTFCVIPYARGKVRSVPPESVIKKLESLARQGFKEVVLSGTQLSQYGWDIGTSLEELLKSLTKVRGVELIRLSSMHIKEMENSLLELITEEEKIAPHFHLSLQSGSDRILALMERGYTREEYGRVVEYIIGKRNYTSIGTDVIVGFPTESDEDFEDTLNFIKGLSLAYLHVFPYSDRPYTKAGKLKPKVSESVKKERVKTLKELDKELRQSFREKNSGRKLRAVVLKNGKALTENYIEVKLKGEHKPGELIEVVL